MSLPHVGGACKCARGLVDQDCHVKEMTAVRAMHEAASEKLGVLAAQTADAKRKLAASETQVQMATATVFDLKDRVEVVEAALRGVRSLTIDKFLFLGEAEKHRTSLQSLANDALNGTPVARRLEMPEVVDEE